MKLEVGKSFSPYFKIWDMVTLKKCLLTGIHYDEYGGIETVTILSPDGETFERPIEAVTMLRFTELYDIHGVKIFENDFVVGRQYLTTSFNVPTEIKGIVKYSAPNTMFYLKSDDDYSDTDKTFISPLGGLIYEFEVIEHEDSI